MKTVQITLPDQLLDDARRAGLLTPEALAQMLRERLRAERIAALGQARQLLAADPLPPMSATEINAEIDAYRAGQSRASGA